MIKEDIKTFNAIKKEYVQSNSANDTEFVSSIVDSLYIRKSNSDTTIISNLTDPNKKNSDGTVTVLSLNYSSDNSAMVMETLIGAQDLNEAREREELKKKDNGH